MQAKFFVYSSTEVQVYSVFKMTADQKKLSTENNTLWVNKSL